MREAVFVLRYNEKIMNKTYDSACATEKVCTVKICATLAHRSEIIAMRSNSNKSHPFQKKYARKEDAIYLHAENNCIVAALRSNFDISKLKNCSLYVARAASFDEKNLSWGNARPCKGCQRSIATFGIKNVFFTTRDGVSCL